MSCASLAALILSVSLLLPSFAADADAVKSLLDKSIKASGGEANLAKVPTPHWKGKGQGRTPRGMAACEGEWAVRLPDRLRAKLTIGEGDKAYQQVRVLNGERGWLRRNDDNAVTLDADSLAVEQQGLLQQRLTWLLPLREKEFTVTLLGESKLDGKPVLGLEVKPKEGAGFRLFFDAATSRLVQAATTVRDVRQAKEVAQETRFADYKDVQGVQRAHKITVLREGQVVLELELSDMQLHEKLDDALFTRP